MVRASGTAHNDIMSFTFVLVHGHWHGAWAWSEIVPLLQKQGHHVLTPQLPSDRYGFGAAANARAVREEIEAYEDARATITTEPSEIVLVGHSAGGLTIPLVAQQSRVLHMIFLAAVLPLPRVSLAEQFLDNPGSEVAGFTWTTRTDGLLEMPADVARQHFFHDCLPDVAEEAIMKLRLQTPTTIDETSPLTRWPKVSADYVVCQRDRVLAPAWQRRLASERLGTTPIEIDSGHSAALSRPHQLVDLLIELATRRARSTTQL